MKKHFVIIAVMLLASVSFAQAQLVVSDAGNVGIKLPNETNIPLSPLSIGGTGNSTILTSMTGTSKNIILDVSSTSPLYSSSMGYGIYTSISGSISSTGNFGIYSVATGSGGSYNYGFGVVGLAGNYSGSYGVLGGLSNSSGNGVGIFGQTSSSIPVTPSGRYAGYFSGDVVVTGTINGVTISPSDVSYKQNIADIDAEKTLNGILSLHPVSYNLKQRYMDTWDDGKTKQVPVYDEQSDPFQKKHYGLVAQEVKEIYPELVYSNAEGILAINYTGLIPLLIESVKELKAEINELKAGREDAGSLRSATGLENPAVAQCKLYQNAPNPFSQTTRIKVVVANDIKKACLTIYDLQGKQLKQIAVIQRGESLVDISGSEFPAGIYLYALIADGQKVDLKQMILTE
jgi:hypothetical protein